MSWSPGYGKQSPIKTGSQTGNSSITALLNGEVFNGDFETNSAPDAMIVCYTDQPCTLKAFFSPDGVNEDSSLTYNVTSTINEFHVPVKGPRPFRVQLTNNSGSNQTYLRLYVYYGTFKLGTAPINLVISDDADAIVTKSVISGVGDTTAHVTDHGALQVSPPPEGKSAFGEALTTQSEPVVQLVFTYSLNTLLVKTEDNGGTSSVDTSMMKLSTGAAANQSSTMLSREAARYEAGMGLKARFTGLFTTGVANSTQIIGVGDSGEGFFFGYNGATFGILRRYGGNPEIRTLTVTTASSTAENITITLDGDADATVAVTASANTTTTANEIAAHDYSGLGRGWTATAVGATVVFSSWSSESRTGTYSLSGATTAVGTFAQTLAGVSPTETWTAQASWNGDDIFDGTGITGVTLDPTKGNVFQIDFQYLGFGLIRFFVEDPDDGEMHLVHSIEYANANTRPSLDSPTMHLYASVENTSNTSDIILKSASMALFVDGKRKLIGINRGVEAVATSIGTGEVPLLSIRVNDTFSGKLNRSQIKINIVSASVEHTKPVRVNFYANPTLTDASFSLIDSTTSAIQKDTSATTLSGGVFLFSLPLGKSGNATIDLKNELDLGRFGKGDVLTVSTEPSQGSSYDAVVAFNITEMF